MAHEPGEEYAGPATLASPDGPVEVEVDLRGRFEPLDGRFHWYGRVARGAELDHASGSTVTLITPYGEAEARLSDVDPWGRLRITGTGKPPF
jgi:hypothetical protein